MAFRAIRGEVIAIASKHPWSVLMLIVPLKRVIAGGMAIHAARIGYQYADLCEDRPRPVGFVGN